MANELDFGTGIALIKGLGGKPTDAQVTSAVDAWLDNHPEATTTVEDGSITKAKLDSNLQDTVDDVGVLKTAIDDLEDAIANKANVDGSYPDMTVGNAEQLVATVGVEDAVPYNFRTAGGSADIGDREVDKVVGGTVAFNQLFDFTSDSDKWLSNGSVVKTWNNGALTVSGASTTNAYAYQEIENIAGHKYLYEAKGRTIFGEGVIGKATLAIRSNDTSINISKPYEATDTVVSGIFSSANSTTSKVQVRPNDTANQMVIYYYVIFDLTQMFGSTIADYIYSLEQATAGAGVAWFRKMFPKPYYAYNAGELMSVQTSAHKMVGFNAWDEESEEGYYDVANNGAKASSASWKRCKNLIPCTPSTNYYFYSDYTGAESFGALIFYDAAGNQISYKTSNVKNAISTTPADCHYMSFYAKPAWFDHNICINLSWDGERDGEYEPYQAWEYPLDSDLVLRGIPKLDADNNLYYDGDTYESDGTVTRRYGVVDLGTLTWDKTGEKFYSTSINTLAKKGSYSDGFDHLICVKYIAANVASLASLPDKAMSIDTGGNLQLNDSAFAESTPNELATALSGVMLVYEFAESTAQTADPYQNPQIVEDFGTEEYIDTRTVAIPVGHDTTYRANLRAKLEMAPNSPDGDGDYIVRQANGQNEYVPLTKELPAAPTSDGNYILKCTVASGAATYTWEAQT